MSVRRWWRGQPVTMRAAYVGGLVAIVVLLGTVAGQAFVAGHVTPPTPPAPPPPPPADVRLAGVAFSPADGLTLNVSLHNVGGMLAAFSHAEVRVERMWVLSNVGCMGSSPVVREATAGYVVKLPFGVRPYARTFELPHDVAPDATDRVQIRFEPEADGGLNAYGVSVRFVYGNGTQEVVAGPMVLMASTKARPYGGFSESRGAWGCEPPEDWRYWASRDAPVARLVASYLGADGLANPLAKDVLRIVPRLEAAAER